MHQEMLIAGHFIGGPCDQSTGKSVSRNPYDGSAVGTAAEGGFGELRTAVIAAREAFERHRFDSFESRQALLRRIAELVRERRDELVELLVLEVGKPVKWAMGEVDRLALTFDLAATELDHWSDTEVDLGYDPRGPNYRGAYRRFPIGVVFGIVPYNWPFNLAAHKIAPALAVGNAIVLKAAPQAVLCTLMLGRIIHDAGCPPGLVSVWNGPPQAAEKAIGLPEVAMLSFTGSPAVGWLLKSKFPELRVTLELGGDASALVFEDADLDWAVERIVLGKFGFAGQICISVQHARVQAGVYEEVRDRLTRATRECAFGDPTLETTVCGPMISADAANTAWARVEDALEGGASLLAGAPPQGAMFPPTLLEGVPPESKLATEEVFAPVLTIGKFESEDEAFAAVNRSQFGIHCGVFTHDSARQRRAFETLEVGGVVIDDYPTLRFDRLPYGGVKRSGFGREGVRFAMEEMSELKSCVRRIQPVDPS